MKQECRSHARGWEKKKFKTQKGQEISLSTLLTAVRDAQSREAAVKFESLPEYLTNVHPWLYYRYLLNWEDFPESKLPMGFNSGIALFKHINHEWEEVCLKKKCFDDEMLDNYKTIDQLRQNNAFLLTAADGKELIRLPEGYQHHEERLYEMRQQQIDEAEQIDQQKQNDLRLEQELALAEGRIKEANQHADDLRRQIAARANEQQAAFNRAFSRKEGSPWSASVTDTATAQAAIAETPKAETAATVQQHDDAASVTPQPTPKKKPSPRKKVSVEELRKIVKPVSVPSSESVVAESIEDSLVSLISRWAREIADCKPEEIHANLFYSANFVSDNSRFCVRMTVHDVEGKQFFSGCSFSEALDRAHSYVNAAIEERRLKAEEEARLKAEAEARRKAEEEQAKKDAERESIQDQLAQLMKAAALLQDKLAAL